jgi:ribosome-binding protein aMBF1 (putative translation factor)
MEQSFPLTDKDQTIKDETHDEMIARWMQEPELKAAYDALEDQYAFFEECVKARRKAKLTQKEVAERMGTKESAVARLESLAGSEKGPSPSISTLQKYAAALGCRLVLKLKPSSKRSRRKPACHEA